MARTHLGPLRLLILLPLLLVACKPATDFDPAGQALGSSGEAAGPEADAEELQEGGSVRRVTALLGFSGDSKGWGVQEGEQVLPAKGFYLLAVDRAVLVLESAHEEEERAVVEDFRASELEGEGGKLSVFRFLGFASDGGLGTTRFKLQGSAETAK